MRQARRSPVQRAQPSRPTAVADPRQLYRLKPHIRQSYAFTNAHNTAGRGHHRGFPHRGSASLCFRDGEIIVYGTFHRARAERCALARRMSLRVVLMPSRTMRPFRNRTSLTPVNPFDATPFRTPSMTNTRTPGSVKRASLPHFSTREGGHIASAVKLRPRACVNTEPRLTKVLPVPHSATAAAARASSQRLTIPRIARV